MAARAKHVYRFGAFHLDATDRLLYRDGVLVSLPPKVFDTLLLLVTHRGQVLGKGEMLKQLWPDTFVEEGTLAQYISLLRKTLGDSASWIENHPRRGYRFTAPVEEIGGHPAELRIEEHIRSRTGWFRITFVGVAVLIVLAAAATVIRPTGREKLPGSFSSVAVIPFRTVSDAGGEYLADGITEALITRLANLEGLRVVSYSRVRRFKGSSAEAAEIGRQLGVEAVIEGSVRIASGRLRLSVHAVDTKSGYTIWAMDRFEANSASLLDIEGQLAEAAALRFKGQLTASERRLVTNSGATNPEAYDFVLRARGLMRQGTAADLQPAVQMLERAARLDPGLAEAYGWLAMAHLGAYRTGLAGPQTLRAAISNANQALSRDPNSSVAMRALSHIQHTTGRAVEGLIMARRVLESNPDDLDATAAAAEAYFRTGLYDRAIPLYAKALAGEPDNPEFRSQLARIYLFLGDYKKGIEVISLLPPSQAGVFGMLLYAETGQMDKATEIVRADPRTTPYGFAAYIRGWVLAAAGDPKGAREIWTEAARYMESLREQQENPYTSAWLGVINAKLGRREQALHHTRQSLAADPQHPVLSFFAAQARALVGDRRQALENLKAAVENGFFNLPMMEYHTRPRLAFHSLREDPEFRALRAALARRIDDLRVRF